MLLPFHLEGEHRVTFRANQDQEQVAAGIESQSSVFLDWMKYNAANTDGRDLFFSDFPMHYTHVKNKGWHLRKKGHTIGRMPVAIPRQGERFYLRSLLTVKRGATSYEDLYTVNGVRYEVPSAACRAWGLIYDDSEWISLYNEVKNTTSAACLRYQFAVNLADSEILEPQRIWDLYEDNFTDDCLYRIQRMSDTLILPPVEWSENERRIDYGLWLLGENLRDFGMDFAAARLRGSRHRWVNRHTNVLIDEALDFDRGAEADSNRLAVQQLSLGQ
ncbi:Atp-dependent dna helicase, partial [Thalictrum thalictroides]